MRMNCTDALFGAVNQVPRRYHPLSISKAEWRASPKYDTC